jgi:integrase
MNTRNSTPSTAPGKPAKPYEGFPLFPPANKLWAKKIRGRTVYFGPWNDLDAALDKYLKEKDDLLAGRMPRANPAALTIKELVNNFLAHKATLRDNGELSRLTWGDYKSACDEVVAAFGKNRLLSDIGPDDFAKLRDRLAGKWGLHRLCKTIQFVRCIFKYAYEADLLDKPVRFGPGFKRPTKKTMRLHRAAGGPKLFTPDEIRSMIDAAPTAALRAMILLGINCGFGNSDCGNLNLTYLDLDAGVIDYPRPKTGVARRCVLWPETVAAIKEALAQRPNPKKPQHTGLVFLTRLGVSWNSFDTGSLGGGPLSHEVSKLLKKLVINGRRNYYVLRHTFRTVADEAKDQPAADYIMGHESSHMSSVYRERISDERLKAVADHVRGWLFPSAHNGIIGCEPNRQ